MTDARTPPDPPLPARLPLAADFPPATDADWLRLAGAVLRKSDPDIGTQQVTEALSSSTYDGLTLAPLYTPGSGLPDSGLPGRAPFTRGAGTEGGWDVRQRHDDPDPAATREAILADLENGVTSLWLVLGPAGLPVQALAGALDGVYLDLAGIVLNAGEHTGAAADALFELLRDRGVDPATAHGNLGADPLGLAARTGAAADYTDLRELA